MGKQDETPPPRGIWEAFVAALELLIVVAAILACGMLFSTVFIPNRGEQGDRPTPIVPSPPPSLQETTTDPNSPTTTIPERESPSDLPELFDTTDWPDSSPTRKQPFLEELAALNFTRPLKRSVDYRLSGVDMPLKYEVRLSVRIRDVDGEPKSVVEGQSRTHFERIGEGSNIVELNVFGLYITNVSLFCSGHTVPVLKHSRDNRKQSLIVSLAENLAQGSKCVMELFWTKCVATSDNTGVYETWFSDENGTFSYSLTTHGETMHTRKWMPCFDEPKYKAPLILSIEHPSQFAALSNAPVRLVERANAEGRSLTSFEPTWSISSYLYTFSVIDYVKMDAAVDGLQVSVYVPPPLSSQLPKLMKDLEEIIPLSLNLFKAPRINTKLDFIFLPDHSSAMENPGHISLGTAFLRRKDTFVHEMMHQYFGNLITCEWWSDLWINEGFANFYEDVAMAKNDTKVLLGMLREHRQQSMKKDVYDTSIPLHTRVDTLIESRYMFRNPYTKGACVINMLRDYTGPRRFDATIEKMLNDRANSTLSLFQFKQFLAEIGGEKGNNAMKIASDFLEQPGYPLLLIRHSENTTKIRQVRFHRGFSNPQHRDFDTRWTIPIHLISLDGRYSKTIILEKAATEMESTDYPGLLIVDPSKICYYRIVYDRPTYTGIRASKLSEEQKDTIELDLLESAFFGYVDAAAAFDTITKRSSKKVITSAYASLETLFGKDKDELKQAKNLLEKLSGLSVSRRHNREADHDIRDKQGSDVVSDDEYEYVEDDEEWEKKQEEYCSSNLTDRKAFIKYNVLLPSGNRALRPLYCMFARKRNASESERNSTMTRWIRKLYDNHDTTFHMSDARYIGQAIERVMPDNFVQDFIVDRLNETSRYYSTILLSALDLFNETHIEQAERLIRAENAITKAAAAENWMDIANLFERSFATKLEREVLRPIVLNALKKLAEA